MKTFHCLSILATAAILLGSCVSAKKLNVTEKLGAREGKVVSLFNVVSFENKACTSTSALSSSGTGGTRRNGTCYTMSECSNLGGSPNGNCASGFGVCCVFMISTAGKAVSQNCSYIQNPGFPNALTSTTQIMHRINKCANTVCRIRLDFEAFTIKGTGFTTEVTPDPTDPTLGVAPAGGVCLDKFEITTTSGQNIPTVCGQNTGHHMYIDLGQGDSDSATLSFSFDTTTNGATSRQYEIKVTQLPCNAFGPPSGCLQWHTGINGRITTFNFIPTTDNHLAEQEYSICVRQEKGYCCVEYSICTDIDSFSLGKIAVTTAHVDEMCTQDYIRIAGSSGTCNQGDPIGQTQRFCGNQLHTIDLTDGVSIPVCDCTAPFAVDIRTDNADDSGSDIGAVPNTLKSRGVCLTYNQIPCL